MGDQAAAVGKPFLTAFFRAGKGFGPGMVTQVTLHPAASDKLSAAVVPGADKGGCVGVPTQVNGPVTGIDKPFGTAFLRADIGLFLRVHEQVRLQMGFAQKALVAVFVLADEGPFS